MSTAVVQSSQVLNRRKVRRKYVDYAVFTLCASLYLLPFMRFLLQGTDEGTLIYGAIRIIHGQVFARDFFEVIGPGTFYWIAVFFKLFGVSFFASRLCLFVSSLGTVIAMYFLSRRVCAEYRTLPCILLAGTYFGMLWPTLSHHVDSNFSALLCVVCTVIWLDRRRGLWLFAAGGLAAATMCFHQPKGALLFGAITLWLCWIQRHCRPEALRTVSAFTAGFLVPLSIVAAYFWSQTALGPLIYANFIWPSRHYGGVNSIPYARGFVHAYWSLWVGPPGSARWRIAPAALLSIPFLLVAGLPGILTFFGIWKWKSFTRPEVLLYWLCGWAMWVAEFHRKDICHLVFGAPLLIVLCVYYLEQFRARPSQIALQIIAISSACLASYGLLLALLAPSRMTRFGVVHAFRPDPILAALESRTRPGEEIFAYPYIPMYYVLSGTTNPTRYSLLTYNYNTPSQFRDVVRVLEKRRVMWVVWDSSPESLAGGFLFPLPKGERRDTLVIEPYLESHYRVVQENHGILLLERNPESH